jgi:transmembrane sensor
LGQAAARGAPADPVAAARRVVLSRRAMVLGGVASATGALAVVAGGLEPGGLEAIFSGGLATGYGERKTFAAAEGVTVELNTRSRMKVKDGAAAVELVLFAGEALVSASRARKVEARAGALALVSTGAVFALRLIADKVRVGCVSGLVEVRARNDSVELIAGQELTTQGQKMGAPRVFDVAAVEAWRQGLLHFNDRPLSEVVDEINRYRRGKVIVGEKIAARRVSGVFQISRLDEVVQQLCVSLDAQCVILPGDLVIIR